MLASYWAQNYFLCPVTDKHSHKPSNCSFKSNIPETLLPFLENFRRPFSWPNWLPLILVSEDERVADGQVKIRECTLWQWTSIACGIQNKNNKTQQRLRLIKGCWIKILSIWYIYIYCPRRDFAQKANSWGGTLVPRAYIKESTYSWNIQSVCQKKSRFAWTGAARNR